MHACEEISRLGQSMGMSVRGYLDWLIEVGRPTLNVGDTIPWVGVLN